MAVDGGDGGVVGGGGGKIGGGGTVLRRNLGNPFFCGLWILDFNFFFFWVFFFLFLVLGLMGIDEESNLKRGKMNQ